MVGTIAIPPANNPRHGHKTIECMHTSVPFQFSSRTLVCKPYSKRIRLEFR